MRRIIEFAVILVVLVSYDAFAADLNGYTAKYERKFGTPPPCNVTIKGAGDSNWATLNDPSYRVICLEPGDYSSLGKIGLTASGSPGKERWLRYYSANDDGAHPVHQALNKRAKVHRIEFNGASYWIIHRITVDLDGANNLGVSFPGGSNSNNNVLDKMLIEDGAGGNKRLVMIKGRNDNNTIQNSVIRNTEVAPGEDNECVQLSGGIRGTRIVNNEIHDCNKPIAIKSSAPGAIIENNDLYSSPARFTDCNGNYTPNNPDSPCSVGEGLISMKGAGIAAEPVRIIHNRLWGARRSDEICCAASGFGAAISISQAAEGETDYVLILNNIIGESQFGFSQPRSGPDHNSIIGNVLYDIRHYNKDGTSYALNARKGTHTEWYLNTISGSDSWLNISASATSNDIRCNVVINGGSQAGAAGAGTVVDYNAFYNSAPYTTVSPGHNIVQGNVLVANTVPYCFYRKLLTGQEKICIADVLPSSASPHYQGCDPDIGSRANIGIN